MEQFINWWVRSWSQHASWEKWEERKKDVKYIHDNIQKYLPGGKKCGMLKSYSRTCPYASLRCRYGISACTNPILVADCDAQAHLHILILILSGAKIP